MTDLLIRTKNTLIFSNSLIDNQLGAPDLNEAVISDFEDIGKKLAEIGYF